jgi:hypothetical protein
MTKFCNLLKNKYPTFSSSSFVCSSKIKTTNDDRMIAGLLSETQWELGVSQKPQFFVIARRNDEAIRLLSGISGLLHFVRNDEIGLSRHPQPL